MSGILIFIIMSEIHEQIKEIEADAKLLVKKCDLISTERRGFVQKKNIERLQDGLRWWQRTHLGELKNSFGIGIKQEIENRQT